MHVKEHVIKKNKRPGKKGKVRILISVKLLALRMSIDDRVWDLAQLVEHWTGTSLVQVWFPGVARDFFPRVNFQWSLSYSVRTPLCAITCINICAHVKDPVVHASVRWIMETLKHPAYTIGWVAGLCQSWQSPGTATRISHGRNPIGTIQL